MFYSVKHFKLGFTEHTVFRAIVIFKKIICTYIFKQLNERPEMRKLLLFKFTLISFLGDSLLFSSKILIQINTMSFKYHCILFHRCRCFSDHLLTLTDIDPLVDRN